MSSFSTHRAYPDRRYDARSADTLCCCEYVNKQGDRSHVLACCCDCEALDSACDQLLTCRGVNNRTLTEMFSTIEDRLRIPSLTGKGAIKVNLDVALPVVLVPSALLIGTLHPALTILMLVFLPLSLITSYRLWIAMKSKPRTRLFFTYGIVSYVQMYATFELIVCNMWEVRLWENLICTTLFLMLLYALYHIRKDPGVIKSRSGNTAPHDMMEKFTQLHDQQHQHHPAHQHNHSHSPPHSADKTPNSAQNAGETSVMAANKDDAELATETSVTIEDEAKEDEENLKKFGPIGMALIKNMGFDKNVLQLNVEEKKREIQMRSYYTPGAFVTNVDSRMTSEGSVLTWCEACKLEKPPRAGHCNVCGVCVHCRDHHCVWVDSCIGGYNHRAFIFGILLFIAGGAYGVHLSLTTICTPDMYGDWFLYPADCRYMYQDFPTALVFVSCIYSLIAVFGMTLVLLTQCLFISHNVTSEEMHKAFMRGWTRGCGFVPTHHLIDRGFFANWWNFLMGGRAKQQRYESGGKTTATRQQHSCDCGC